MQRIAHQTYATYIAATNGTYTATQGAAYYPFGLAIDTLSYSLPTDVSTTPNPYLYNGKELQTQLGLQWLDYGFRYYDPVIGRFTGIDPIAEKYYFVTTYNYAENSPIANIDLWGLQAMEFGIIMKLSELHAKFSGPLYKAGSAGMKLMTNQKATDNIPHNVGINSNSRQIINTTSKLQDVKDLKEGVGEFSELAARETSNALQNTGNGIKAIGYGAAPFTGGASLNIVPIGEGIEKVGSILDITIDAVNSNIGDATSKLAIELLFDGTGDLIKSESITKSWTKEEEGILRTINEVYYQASSKARDTASQKLEENKK